MDIKDYISSGIIESYVLGSVSPQERKEVECMSHIYPEIDEVVKKQQKIIEDFAMANSVKPPNSLKAKIFEHIKEINNLENKATVVPISESKLNIFRPISIAASILLLIFGYGYYQLNKENKVLATSLTELVLVKEEVSALNKANKEFENKISFYKDELTTKVELLGTENHSDLALSLFWNKSSNQVVVYGNSLPKLSKEKEYQLWAIIDSVPVSLGKLDSVEETIAFIALDNNGKIEAFAVTIEPVGGSEFPTMEEMQVVGNA